MISNNANRQAPQGHSANNVIRRDKGTATETRETAAAKLDGVSSLAIPVASQSSVPSSAVTLPLSHSPEFSHSPLTGSSAAANGYKPFPKFEEPPTDGSFMQDSAAELLPEYALMDWTEREKETRKLIQPELIGSPVMFKDINKNIIIFGVVKSIYQEKSRGSKDVEVPLRENMDKLCNGAEITVDGSYHRINTVTKEGDVLTITTGIEINEQNMGEQIIIDSTNIDKCELITTTDSYYYTNMIETNPVRILIPGGAAKRFVDIGYVTEDKLHNTPFKYESGYNTSGKANTLSGDMVEITDLKAIEKIVETTNGVRRDDLLWLNFSQKEFKREIKRQIFNKKLDPLLKKYELSTLEEVENSLETQKNTLSKKEYEDLIHRNLSNIVDIFISICSQQELIEVFYRSFYFRSK